MRESTKKQWLITFAYPWSDKYVYGGGNIIMLLNKEGYNILWINPMPHGGVPLGPQSQSYKVLFKRILNKLKSYYAFFRRVNDRFFVITPYFIPMIKNPLIEKLNILLIKLQILLGARFLRIENPIVCTMGATDYTSIIKRLNYRIWFHHAGDLYHDLRHASDDLKKRLYTTEKSIFNQCDIVFAASYKIMEKINTMVEDRSKVVYLPHGVDYEHFANRECNEIHFKGLKRPIIGYYGSLTEANDQDIYCAIAEAGYTLVLIGNVLGDYSKCKKYKNIVFIDAVPYDQIPTYASCFDVAIMAWKKGRWIENCNPKKTYEYLALGLPVVSIPIPQVIRELEEFVRFASTPDDFVSAIEHEIKFNSEEKKIKRKLRAREESWVKKLEILKKYIYEYDRCYKS